MPVSFADATLLRFTEETSQPAKVTRQMLADNKKLYTDYIDWWGKKRRDFLVYCRDYLRENGIDDAMVLFTNNAGEPGVGFNSWEPRFIADKPSIWQDILTQKTHLTSDEKPLNLLSVQDVVKQGLYREGLLSPALSWGGWENNHVGPASDPQHYKDLDGVMISHAFNRLYTVADPNTLDDFSTKTGLALMRHFSLNENMMNTDSDGKKRFLGYFVADMEKAGPYCMMAEAMAMANGNPTLIGYLSGGMYTRGFPTYVRNFNAHYLALPALPSKRQDNLSSNAKIVVRTIDAGKHGTYFYVINTSMTAEDGIIQSPAKGSVQSAVTGSKQSVSGGKLALSLYPYELRSYHIPAN